MTSTEPDFGVLLALAHVTFVDRLQRHMQDLGFTGFTVRTGFVLRVLGEEPMSLRQLADRLEMSSPAALKVTETITAQGYVERVPTARDRRVRAVVVTDRGREARVTARLFHAQLESELAAAVGAEAVARSRAVLGRLTEGSAVVPRALRTPNIEM